MNCSHNNITTEKCECQAKCSCHNGNGICSPAWACSKCLHIFLESERVLSPGSASGALDSCPKCCSRFIECFLKSKITKNEILDILKRHLNNCPLIFTEDGFMDSRKSGNLVMFDDVEGGDELEQELYRWFFKLRQIAEGVNHA